MEQTIGQFIASTREGLKKSRRQLAREAGISDPYLGEVEKDESRPSPETLRKLSKPLHVPYEALLRIAGYLNLGEKPHRPKIDMLASAAEELEDGEIDMAIRVIEDIKRLREERKPKIEGQ